MASNMSYVAARLNIDFVYSVKNLLKKVKWFLLEHATSQRKSWHWFPLILHFPTLPFSIDISVFFQATQDPKTLSELGHSSWNSSILRLYLDEERNHLSLLNIHGFYSVNDAKLSRLVMTEEGG